MTKSRNLIKKARPFDECHTVQDGPLDTPCHIWNGNINVTGYGRYSGKLVHRLSYERNVGPIPTGLSIDHLCRVRTCVNPLHLEAVSLAENTRREVAYLREARQNRSHCKAGHSLSEEGSFSLSNGFKRCRECHRIRKLRHKAKGKDYLNDPSYLFGGRLAGDAENGVVAVLEPEASAGLGGSVLPGEQAMITALYSSLLECRALLDGEGGMPVGVRQRADDVLAKARDYHAGKGEDGL